MSDSSIFSSFTSADLTPAEKKSIGRNLQAYINAHPRTEGPSLGVAEKAVLRAELQFFTGNRPLSWGMAPELAPLPVWLGTNLFGHLQPFAVS